MNLNNRKNEYEKEDTIMRLSEKFNKFEQTCKNDIDEMKEFIH